MPCAQLPTAVVIPQEISDHIISFAKFQTSSLTSCSLVCRAWLASSRTHLFQVVALDHHNVDSFTSLVLSSLSTIPPFVKRLELSPKHVDSRWFRRLIPFLEVMTSVEFIHLEKIDWPCLNPSSRSNFFSSFRPTLIHLEMKDLVFKQFDDVLDVICAFPLLQSLALSHICWDVTSTNCEHASLEVWKGRELPRQITSLSLRHCPIRTFIAWLLAHKPIPVLTSLEVGPVEESDTPNFGRYIAFLGKRLLKFRIFFRPAELGHMCSRDAVFLRGDTVTLPPTEEAVEDDVGTSEENVAFAMVDAEHARLFGGGSCPNLGSLTRLRSLYLEDFICGVDDDRSSATFSSWAPRVLLSMKSLELEEIVLGVSLSRCGELDGHSVNWHLLDRMLTEGRKEALKAVRIAVGGSVKKDGLAELISARLPVCAARGKLQFFRAHDIS